MASISQMLLSFLDELERDSLDRFKSSLKNDLPEGFASIPRSKLEDAKQLKVVELMVDQYGDSDAAYITVHVLKQINKIKLATDLEKELGGKMSGASRGPAMAQGTQKRTCTVLSGADFVNNNRGCLIQKVSSVMEIVDCLLSKKMLTDEIYNRIDAAVTSQEKMRILYKSFNSEIVKEEFYKILKEKQPYLVAELES